MAQTAGTTSRFLELPGELRNRIYRLALLSDNAIPVTAQHFQEPDLLHACKQVRREAMSIFYGENEFDVLHIGFDSAVQIKMLEKEVKLRDEYKVPIKWFICTRGPRNWANLLTWLKHIHRGTVLGWVAGQGARSSAEFAIVDEMFDTCEDLNDLPWERVAGVMERFHKILVGVSGSWAAVEEAGG
ncbi:hypothetical protein LTR36_005147 [Oleoguttula mirabilis]|uniref:2EXR domain-containing protein n=1 Tax=Oleoguttula mirabilis TaxID=1507867 RepID=A0AAV9JW54_9PEZI|nr:hypothetical protein LTR36_005147 [Oleoguttula mirabilis]